MTNKFKVGDEVRYLKEDKENEDLKFIQLNDICEIIKTDSPKRGDILIKSKRGLMEYVNESEIELIEKENKSILKDKPNIDFYKQILIKQVEDHIQNMKDYLLMNVDREDWHACWDASIDLARLNDKLEWLKEKD